jgi:hypothetical protein
MSTTQQARIRAVSARLANSTPTVPGSLKARKFHQKTELVENYPASLHPSSTTHNSFHKSKVLAAMRSNFQEDPEEFSKMLPKPEKIPKEPEELFEENMHLKKRLHRMNEELVRNRTKI